MGRIDVHVVPDPNTNLGLMRSGVIDFNLIAPAQRKSLEHDVGVRFLRTPTALVAGLAINLAHPPLDDPVVRRAIAESIDRQAISRLITLGKYPVVNSDRPGFSFAQDPSIREPGFDPDAADRDFAKAGWQHGPGGILVKDGHVFEMTYVLFPESATGVRIGTFVQQELSNRGVEVAQKIISSKEMFLPEFGLLALGQYDMAYVPWTMSADPDDSFLFGVR